MSSPKEKLNRASWTLLQSIRDYTLTTIATAIQSGKFKLDQTQAKQLQDLLSISLEAGYHRAAPGFIREVDGAIEEIKKNS
jgi:hypothetical protein